MDYRIIEKEIFYRDKRIYGLLYQPNKEKFPLLIISHGLGGSYQGSQDFEECFAENGIGVYAFDFCGGSDNTRSSHTPLDMSVVSEAEDLEAVLTEFENDEHVDTDRIFLLGKSQGAFVSTIVLSKHPEIRAFIGLYPGYVLQERIREEMEKYEEIPEKLEILWITVGRKYVKDLLSLDIYEMMKECDSDVLLIHGMKDSIVPFEFTQKAYEAFRNCTLVTLQDAEHGFHGPEREGVMKMCLDFVKERI